MSVPEKNFDAIIVGGGPAGLSAAINLASKKYKCLLVERMPECGRKLLATGGGKCNLTNALSPGEMAKSFGKKQEPFCRRAIYAFPPEKLRSFFAEMGIPTSITDGFHCFPDSGKASDIRDSMLAMCRKLDVKIINHCTAQELVIDKSAVCGIKTDRGNFFAPAVILAAGGKSFPKLGSDGSGFKIAAAAGHQITPLFPAMAGIHLCENFIRECSGISLPDVTVKIALPGHNRTVRGEILFTHHGISGFPALDISGEIAVLCAQKTPVPLQLNLISDRNENDWLQTFNCWQQQKGTSKIANLLSAHLPRKLAFFLAPDTVASRFSATARKTLAAKLTALPLSATEVDDWSKAMLTAGGVALDEVDAKSMQSKIVSGLFFAGEILDVDGPCGGYNLQWAFSSGFAIKLNNN